MHIDQVELSNFMALAECRKKNRIEKLKFNAVIRELRMSAYVVHLLFIYSSFDGSCMIRFQANRFDIAHTASHFEKRRFYTREIST